MDNDWELNYPHQQSLTEKKMIWACLVSIKIIGGYVINYK
jgi:hypothetical protein